MNSSPVIEVIDEFADFPETHWVGMKAVYQHSKIDRYMPYRLAAMDKQLCIVTEIGYWKVDAGRFCCKAKFPGGFEEWTTCGHLRPLEKPKPKPPAIETVLAKTNNTEDFERLGARLEDVFHGWEMKQKSKTGSGRKR
jgi:hypothetical protein